MICTIHVIFEKLKIGTKRPYRSFPRRELPGFSIGWLESLCKKRGNPLFDLCTGSNEGFANILKRSQILLENIIQMVIIALTNV
jgi:hypothetical protein